MRVKEEFKRLGYFWLPSDRDRKVPGILSISDGGIIKLEVLVPWNSQWVGFNENEVKRIVGRVEKDGPVTLDGCLRKTISADAKSGLSKSIFDVSKAFIGAAYGDEENPRFNTVKFSVERLDNWLGITGLEIEERIEDGKVTISYQPPAVLEMKLSNNMQLSIGLSWTGPAPQGRKIGELRIGQKAFFKIEATNLCELDEFISIYDRVTKLLCFALDDIVLLDSITATSDNLRESVGRQMTPMAPIRIYYLSGPLPKNESTKLQWYCLFRFDTIKSQAERLINNWLDGYEKLSLTLDLYFWTQMKDSQFLEVKFLTLVQGLEVCHRRTSNETQMDNTEFEDLVASLLAECPDDKRKWLQEKFRYGNELSLRKRIKAIIEPFKEIVGDKKQRNVLIHQIVIMRNFLTHGDKSLEAESAKVDLSSLYLTVELIFQLYLIKGNGFESRRVRCCCGEFHCTHAQAQVDAGKR